jgi:hypothetical protein
MNTLQVILVAIGLAFVVFAAFATFVLLLFRLRRRLYISRHGMKWVAACDLVKQGSGCLVLDHAIGRSRSYGQIVVWWLPQIPAGAESIARQILSQGKLTDCPKSEMHLDDLRALFGAERVLENMTIIDT